MRERERMSVYLCVCVCVWDCNATCLPVCAFPVSTVRNPGTFSHYTTLPCTCLQLVFLAVALCLKSTTSSSSICLVHPDWSSTYIVIPHLYDLRAIVSSGHNIILATYLLTDHSSLYLSHCVWSMPHNSLSS